MTKKDAVKTVETRCRDAVLRHIHSQNAIKFFCLVLIWLPCYLFSQISYLNQFPFLINEWNQINFETFWWVFNKTIHMQSHFHRWSACSTLYWTMEKGAADIMVVLTFYICESQVSIPNLDYSKTIIYVVVLPPSCYSTCVHLHVIYYAGFKLARCLLLCRVTIACRFRVTALNGHAALTLSLSGIAPNLKGIQLSVVYHCGQSCGVIN